MQAEPLNMHKIVKTGRGLLAFSVMVIVIASLTLGGQPVSALPLLSVTALSQELIAGEDNVVTFRVSNTGDAFAQDVYLLLTLPSSSSGSLMILKDADGLVFLDDVFAGSYVDVNFTVYVSPNAANTLVSVSITMIFIYAGQQTLTRPVGFEVLPPKQVGAVLHASLSQSEAVAGQNNTLYLRIANDGDLDASLVTATLTLPGATSGASSLVLYGSDGKWIVGDIGVNQSVEIPITIYAALGSIGSIYQLPFTFSYSDSFRAKQDAKYLPLGVPYSSAVSANIEITISPQELLTGTVNDLTLTVNNTGDSTAESISISLAIPGSTSTSSAYNLIGSDASWVIGRLEPGQSTVIPVQIFVAPSASGTMTTFTTTTSFADMKYKLKTQTDYFGMITRGKVAFTIIGTSTYPKAVTPGELFSLTVQFINLGTTTAQSMVVKPSGNQQMQTYLSNDIFMGDVAVNVPTSMTLTYIAGNITNGAYSVTLEYSFRDTLGRESVANLTIPFQITIGSGTNGSSSGQNNGAFGGVLTYAAAGAIGIVVVVAIALLLKKRKRP